MLKPPNRSKLTTLSTLAHVPPTTSFLPPQGSDKIAHFAAFATLALLLATAWQLAGGVLTSRHLGLVWLAVVLYAALDEVTQIPVGRDCNFEDWAADALGAAAGLLLFVWLRRLIERKMSSKE
jgi:VanZ family protein